MTYTSVSNRVVDLFGLYILVYSYWFVRCLSVEVSDAHRHPEVLDSRPHLNGRNLVFTVAEGSSFLDFSVGKDGILSYSGYLIDIIQALARPDRANFTYELRPPSGVGIDCVSVNGLDNAPYGNAYW
jgi:hypothetical protein